MRAYEACDFAGEFLGVSCGIAGDVSSLPTSLAAKLCMSLKPLLAEAAQRLKSRDRCCPEEMLFVDSSGGVVDIPWVACRHHHQFHASAEDETSDEVFKVVKAGRRVLLRYKASHDMHNPEDHAIVVLTETRFLVFDDSHPSESRPHLSIVGQRTSGTKHTHLGQEMPVYSS